MSEAVAVPMPSPVPRYGEVFTDPRDAGRALRVTWHPESRTVVLSLWRDDRCIGTHRLPAADAARLVQALLAGALDTPLDQTIDVTDAARPAP